ncbi:zinc finger and SCAN domain-containing protein 12 isoform X3 [Anopheles darlingi]|uniref:zinc finger and SCAN domain-containing protein 12 isoform X3 n=1 Tax=Anopheles darlingi TaxID=43151 RepID=UPI0020FFF612|nr:zinc finger and SCAN domain-containing protein 12 isoform X3 [Anopheles darlingi]
MGGMLSVLVASVGAMDLIYCLAYVSSNQPAITDGGDGGEKNADGDQQQQSQQQGTKGAKDDGLERYRQSVQEQLDTARRTGDDGVTYAQDGVPYRDGYRVEQFDDQRLDALGVKIRELERRSQEKEQRLEQLNVQLHELERKSVEREQLLIAEVQRSRSVSRAATPEPTGSSVDRLSIERVVAAAADARDSGTPVPSIVFDDGGDGTGRASSSSSGDDRRRASGGSIKFRPIRRDDELRRSVKRRSVASNASQDDRAEELLLLSQLEADEAAQMQDYVPLVYARDDEQHHQHLGDPFGRRHKISPIQELCQLHEDEDHQHEDEYEQQQWIPERSPEPTLAGTITRPWGDIKPGESKEKAIIRRSARSLSIEEEEPARLSDPEVTTTTTTTTTVAATEPTTLQRSASQHTSEAIAPAMAVDSAIITSEQPTLRRTTKESDLASLLTVEDHGSKLIFSGEYTKAMSKDWHSGHFCCWQCDESLTGQRYVLRDEHPYCIKCYENVFANVCEECNKTIGIDSKDLSYKDKHWHEACFLCNKCRISLVDKQFGSKADKIYCGNCYDAQFASRCDGCGEIFRAGTKKMEYKTRQWHEKCFCCCVCKTAIGTKSFIPREQEIYCAGCYEEKYATRCIKCKKIITSGGVTYKNEPWHRECFTCTHCQVSLAGQRFTSRDEKPYCAECFGELFAKRCTSCTKPITGIGGTRFISFEDRHWHNDCFICAICKTSLVGRGFITDEQDVICPECAKQKLM